MKPRVTRASSRNARPNKSSSYETTTVLALTVFGSLFLAHGARGVRKAVFARHPTHAKKVGSVIHHAYLLSADYITRKTTAITQHD